MPISNRLIRIKIKIMDDVASEKRNMVRVCNLPEQLETAGILQILLYNFLVLCIA